jgi:hypothetical protein
MKIVAMAQLGLNARALCDRLDGDNAQQSCNGEALIKFPAAGDSARFLANDPSLGKLGRPTPAKVCASLWPPVSGGNPLGHLGGTSRFRSEKHLGSIVQRS